VRAMHSSDYILLQAPDSQPPAVKFVKVSDTGTRRWCQFLILRHCKNIYFSRKTSRKTFWKNSTLCIFWQEKMQWFPIKNSFSKRETWFSVYLRKKKRNSRIWRGVFWKIWCFFQKLWKTIQTFFQFVFEISRKKCNSPYSLIRNPIQMIFLKIGATMALKSSESYKYNRKSTKYFREKNKNSLPKKGKYQKKMFN
jgi:hypothetical protein